MFGRDWMDEPVVGQNPKQAFGDKKIPLHLAPPAAIAEMCTALREGAMKYGAWNFRSTEVEIMTYIGAIKRHLDALIEGEWIDPDPFILPDGTEVTDIPHKTHIAGILASAAIIADTYHGHMLVDNRPRPSAGYHSFMDRGKKQ